MIKIMVENLKRGEEEKLKEKVKLKVEEPETIKKKCDPRRNTKK